MDIHLLLLDFLIAVQALNLDVQNPQIFSGPQGSYFGFSVDFYQAVDKGMNVLVGAPQLQTNQPEVTKGGGVFLCPWNPPGRNCTLVEVDRAGDVVIQSSDITQKVFKSNQWLGASVRAWRTNIVACAPLQHWNFLRNDKESGVTPTGACYLSSNQRDFHEYAPCRDVRTSPEYTYDTVPDKRYCELGFSAEIRKDGILLVGAPGGYFFQGLYATLDLTTLPKGKPSLSLFRAYPGQKLMPYRNTMENSYKGFSVAFGEFTADKNPELVIGAPGYKDMGIVEIVGNHNIRILIYTFIGDQVAAYFGHSVVVVDINNDGKDDVVVGSPLYMERRTGGKLVEVGRVYVYLQKWSGRLRFDQQILSGFQAYGQFGASISSLGDLDQDGYSDVAVGAPFGGRNEGGCVYIYRGHASGVFSQPSQVLESPLPHRSRFGFSLRGGTDIDANGYPDLLIGAFEAENVYLYRAQPVVHLHTTLFFNPDAINPEKKDCYQRDTGAAVSCFTLYVCTQVTGRSLPRKLEISADIQLDRQKSKHSRRTLFLDSSQASKTIAISLQSNSELVCSNLTAYLRDKSEFKDKLSAIVVSVNFSLVNEQLADTIKPTLHGSTFLQNQTYILLDCGDDNICIPDLHLSATWPDEPLLIGADNLVHVHFNASNFGEGAYEAELYVRLPAGAHYVGVFQESEEKIACAPKKENDTEVVVCELADPMNNRMEILADLQLSFSNLENSGSNITFPMQIKSRNSQNSSNPVLSVQLAVTVKASLELRGSSHPAEVVLPLSNWEPRTDSKKPHDYGEEVIHVYELHNAGPSSVHVQLVVQSPESYQGDFFLYPLDLEVDSEMVCSKQSRLNPLELDIPTATVAPANFSRGGDHRLNKRHAASQDVEDGRKGGGQDNYTVTVEGTKHKHPILLNCSSMPCWKVQCSIQNLERDRRATLKLHSILWVPSFMKRPQEQFTLLSQGSFQVTGVPYRIQPETLLSSDTTADTKVLWVSPDGQKEIPLWWIIVGVLGGLLILALFIFIMWKLGFFQRTRPPTDDQEELTNEQ
ncbi:integrin alpha-IIb [Spea bombifrons]|uniref:integrin alpha-IIb n=1 Tax=Spea bombifrons TaxID=233779 RepID=UPI00234B0883|nr:integrin alpha-IIb [Spea bombifrons]